MTKLNDHFIAMQAMGAAYIAPGEYMDRDGTIYKGSDVHYGFANDMVYMLDGPEQRAAQESQAADLEAEGAGWRADLRKQIEQAETIASTAREQAKAMERRNAELAKELTSAREMSAYYQQDVARLGGMLDMLRELGTIPKVEMPNTNPYSNRLR